MRHPASLTSLFYFWVIYGIADALQCPDGRQVVCDRFCFYVYRPVCGSDFQTYPNSCALYAVRDCCGAFLFILYGGPCMPPPMMPFPQFYSPSPVPTVLVANSGDQGQQTPHASADSQGQQTPNLNSVHQGQQTPNVNAGNAGQQTPNLNPVNQGQEIVNANANAANQGQENPNVNPVNQGLQFPNGIPGNPGLQIPNGIPASIGTISHGSAEANGGANSTAIGTDPTLQHSWTSTAVNAGVNAQVGQQQTKNPSR